MIDPARRFFDDLISIETKADFSVPEKVKRQRISLEQCCRHLTKEDGLTFSNLFGRLEYVCQKLQIGDDLKGKLHEFRIFANSVIKNRKEPNKGQYYWGLKVLARSYGQFFGVEIPADLKAHYENREIAEKKKKHYHVNPEGFRGMLLKIDAEQKELLVQPDVQGDAAPVVVVYNVKGINDELTASVELMQPGQQLQLLETHRNEDGKVVPGLIVLEPDYLLDVTSIARCFNNIKGKNIRAFELFFIARSEVRKLSKAIHKGNVANMFFDELLNEQPGKKKEFKNVLMDSFKSFPLPYTSLDGIDKSYFNELETQFANLRRVVDNEFRKGDHHPIDRAKSNLEVSLMSPELGLQGRMDLFDESPSENTHYQSKILELKSGKLPFPYDNPSIVSEDHAAQVRMYNMLAQRVLGHHPKRIFNAVLYSAADKEGEALRYVSHFKSFEREIINVRNQIVTWEYRFASDQEPYPLSEVFVRSIDVKKYGLNPADKRFSWFFSKFFDYKKLILDKISPLEQQYFFAFSSFISREKILSKVGDGEYTKGLSALWNKTDLSDEDVFNELRDLTIKENHADNENASITLRRPKDEPRFINFRRGDICVLYPYLRDRFMATNHRVLKCSIESLSNEEVTVKLRQKQSSLDYFSGFDTWVLEHDSLDNNFEQMHNGLFEFLQLPPARRELLLGLRPPVSGNDELREFVNVKDSTYLEESRKEQNQVLSSAWNARDYYLLVGPPGTGKTNLFLRRFVKELISETDLNVLLVSYTNRAVDEMCSSVRAIVQDNMIRIGSSLGCDRSHEDLLLDRKIKNLKNRKEIRELIEDTRLFAGTLSSVLGKNELFELKKFDIAIVDEASQILEPNIINLLGRVNRFVLIGDERQLPAVVTQSPAESKVNDEKLHEIGLLDRRNSYFERMLFLCKKNNWNHAWGELTFQGRMHPDLSLFTNRFFYNNKLKSAELTHQKGKLLDRETGNDGELVNLISENRVVFIPSAFAPRDFSEKHNALEAHLISAILKEISLLHNLSDDDEIVERVGVITPFRSQIASIREQLETDGHTCFERLQIDTVERFQGGQKDFILVSFCMNRPEQLDFLAQNRVMIENLTSGGMKPALVDRKLNVTLTRARKQIILTGNEGVLGPDEIYGKLIGDIHKSGGYFKKGARAILDI
ncbi:AAA domain-containing protein [Marinilabilia rubra]|uniref:DNA helicase n=1 Tax=Marinilabilia rubra TaxID=2162893 RepID=A0A2U2B4V7_9BACT|nr:AAA domain-containing protein [Marinilabilia rubra]PWD98092.1 DNA helicase [Marinilabilia rubra]